MVACSECERRIIQPEVAHELSIQDSMKKKSSSVLEGAGVCRTHQPEQFVKWFSIGSRGKFETGERPTVDFGEYGKFKLLRGRPPIHTITCLSCVPAAFTVHRDSKGDVLAEPNTLVESPLRLLKAARKCTQGERYRVLYQRK